MNSRPNPLPHDLKGLRYLDALNSGDLETVAELWEEASGDPELERGLAEIDAALFAEEAVRGGQAGSRRERSATPLRASRRIPARPWVLAVGSLAAACLMIILGRPVPDTGPPPSSPPTNRETKHPKTRPAVDRLEIAAWRQYQRAMDDGEMPTFAWPLAGDSPQLGVRLDSNHSARSVERN